MSTQLRERLEQATASFIAFAQEHDAKQDHSAEATAEFVRRGNELQTLRKAYEAAKEAAGIVGDTSKFLKDISDAPTNVVKDLSDVERTPDGRIANPNGKTLGELWTESEQFKNLDRYKSEGGSKFSDGVSFKSDPFNTGIDLKALITGASATSAGAAVRNDFYSPLTDLVGERPNRITDVITKGTTGSDTVEYVRVTGKTNNAAPFAETTNVTSSAIKAESALALEVVSTTVKTIAHWIPITRRAAADAPQVRTMVDNFLRYGIEEELEDQIISGAGTGENFTGIVNTSNVQTQDATVGGGGHAIDSVLQAISKVRWTGLREPTAIAIHPNDWYSTSFLLKKDSDQRYLIGDPRASADQMNQLWGLRVIVSSALTENQAIVGDFRQAVLWVRSGIRLYMTDSHSDFFVRNVLVILAEMEAAFGVLDPQAFCLVNNV